MITEIKFNFDKLLYDYTITDLNNRLSIFETPSLKTLFFNKEKKFDRSIIDNFFLLLNSSSTHDPFYYENKKTLTDRFSIQKLCDLDEKLFLSSAISLTNMLYLIGKYFNDVVNVKNIVNSLFDINKIIKETNPSIINYEVEKIIFYDKHLKNINLPSINNIFIYNNILRELIVKTSRLILSEISAGKRQIFMNLIVFILNNKGIYKDNYPIESFNNFYISTTKFLIKLNNTKTIFLHQLLINYFFYSSIIYDFLKKSNIKEYIILNNSNNIDISNFKFKKIELLFFTNRIKCIGFFNDETTLKNKFIILDKENVKDIVCKTEPFSDYDIITINDDMFWLIIFKKINKINKQLYNSN